MVGNHRLIMWQRLRGYMASSLRLSVGVSMPQDLVEEIDEETGDESRSAFICTAVRKHIDAENDK